MKNSKNSGYTKENLKDEVTTKPSAQTEDEVTVINCDTDYDSDSNNELTFNISKNGKYLFKCFGGVDLPAQYQDYSITLNFGRCKDLPNIGKFVGTIYMGSNTSAECISGTEVGKENVDSKIWLNKVDDKHIYIEVSDNTVMMGMHYEN